MSAASNYTEANVINALLRGTIFPLPAGTYISLHTADPTDAGGNEVSTSDWPAYARRHAEAGGAIGTGWSEPSNGQSANLKQITFPGMNGVVPVLVTHWAVHDAITGGNMLFHAPLQTSRTLMTGDVFVFDIGALTATMS